MSFFNYNDTFSQQVQNNLVNDLNNSNFCSDRYDEEASFESETQFLKSKLIETHKKLLKELQNSKSLQAKMEKLKQKNEQLMGQKENINSKLQNTMNKKDQKSVQKCRQLQYKLEQVQNKNELLRVDLESMRNKMLTLMMQKSQIQESMNDKESQIQQILQQNRKLSSKLKTVQNLSTEQVRQCESWKKKYQQSVESNRVMSQQLSQLKHQSIQAQQKIKGLQAQVKLETEKCNRTIGQLQNCSFQLKQVRTKYDKSEELCQGLKDKVYWMENKVRTQSKTSHQQLEKLTHQLNQMKCLYNQKEKELQNFKRRPIEEAHKKRENLEYVKDMVHKMEKQQNLYKKQRQRSRQKEVPHYHHYNHKDIHSPIGKNATDRNILKMDSPQTKSKTISKMVAYKQEKNSYITMISQISDMQGQLLQYNLQKNKLSSQMDKIDNTKVKTKQLIARRRKVEDQIVKVQHEIDSVKLQLRKLKVI